MWETRLPPASTTATLLGDPPALVAGAGADVDYPVARRRYLHIVIDQDDAVAGVDQGVELGLGIEGGEGQRRLAGSRHACEHDQSVARDGSYAIRGSSPFPRLAMRPTWRTTAAP